MSNYNKLLAQVLGAVLVLVGLLGFVNSPVLGIFQVNMLHNIVHLLTGAVLLVAGFMSDGTNARMANMILGVVYALVAIVGFAQIDAINSLVGSDPKAAGTFYADPALHALLAVVLLGVAFAFREEAGMGATGNKPAM